MVWNTETFITIAAALLGVGLAGLMYYLEKRPRRDLTPKLFPTTLFLLVGGMLAIGALVHLLALAGIQLPKSPQQ
jgi:hypothetical protein